MADLWPKSVLIVNQYLLTRLTLISKNENIVFLNHSNCVLF